MSFQANVYKILIASPGDVGAEREATAGYRPLECGKR